MPKKQVQVYKTQTVRILRKTEQNKAKQRESIRREGVGELTFYIELGSLWQNAYAESFNMIVCNGCLNCWLYATPSKGQELGDAWLEEHNNKRPHGDLGLMTPAEFKRQRCHQLAS